LRLGRDRLPRNRLRRSSTRVTLLNLVVLGQTVRVIRRSLPAKNMTIQSRFSRSVKVIGTETDRSAAYDLLLTFCNSNHGPISYRFRDNWQFRSKIANFSHLRVFNVPLNGFPLELAVVKVKGPGGLSPLLRFQPPAIVTAP